MAGLGWTADDAGMAKAVEEELAGCLREDGSPDWGTISFELLCARCDYNLRTLTRPRCPECGLEFKWREALERHLRRADALFEHAWRRRPIRSWLKTAWAGLRPGAFWRRVSIHERVAPGPLMVYLATVIIASLLFLFAASRVQREWCRPQMKWASGSAVSDFLRHRFHNFDCLGRVPIWQDYRYWSLPVGMLLGHLGVMVVLGVVHRSMARYQIRPAQLMRVVAYAAPAVCFWECVLLMGLAWLIPFEKFGGPIPFVPAAGSGYMTQRQVISMGSPIAGLTAVEGWAYLLGIAAGMLVIVYAVGRPLRDYLRLPQPWRLALLSALVSALLPAAVISVLSLLITRS